MLMERNHFKIVSRLAASSLSILSFTMPKTATFFIASHSGKLFCP